MRNELDALAPDYERMGAAFDRYLPLIEPVSTAILSRLPPLDAGAAVLDVACGTGEPGLTLARQRDDIEFLGVDAATGMLDVAIAKAEREGLRHVRFEVMTTESLSCTDASIDCVISRFGMMMFGDRAASAAQLARVLRRGGAFSFAVWSDMAKNTAVHAVVQALRPHVAPQLLSPFELFDGSLPLSLLKEAGLAQVETEPFTWHYAFASSAQLWDFVSGPGVFARHFAEFDTAVHAEIRARVESALAAYQRPDDTYSIPHTCSLIWGVC